MSEMETKDKTTKRRRILDSLKNWEKEEKLELIKEIEATIEEKKRDEEFFKLAGMWDDERSAEEITKEIEESRTFSRVVEL